MDANDLRADPIGKRDHESNVALVHGRVFPLGFKEGLSYCQIWVNVTYKRYRSAIKFQIKTTEGALKTVDLYDGDHAVSQTRLAKCWPDAWVNMILAESSINRAVGAMMEKAALSVRPEEDRVAINAECVLKTFLGREGALQRTEIREYLKQARERFLSFTTNLSGVVTMRDLHMFAMANNATVFFDHLARELGLDPIE